MLEYLNTGSIVKATYGREKGEIFIITKRIGDFVYLTMEIDLIFKIAAIGIIVSILNQVLSRSGREEQATMTTLAGLVVVLMMLAQKIADLFDMVKTLFHF